MPRSNRGDVLGFSSPNQLGAAPPWETGCIFAEKLIFWSDARPHLMLHLLGFVFGGK